MKKTLLTLATAALTTSAVWADTTTVNFEGQNDLFGLTRYHTKTQADITFSQEISFQQDGLSFQFKDTNPDGIGFALLDVPNGKAAEQGLAVYSTFTSATFTHPEISISSPGGKISEVKIYLGGSGVTYSFEIDCQGKTISGESGGPNETYVYAWNDTEGTENVSISWVNNYYIRYIHQIEVTYTPDLGGKQASGLSFAASEAQAIMGKDFAAPTLSNPNRLPIVWSSSDKNVARVDAEGVYIQGPGKTTIKAETGGDDTFAAGSAQYTLTVIPSASNAVQLAEFAPNNNDVVYVNFPMTVTFANGSSAFVVDPRDNATMIWNTKNDNSTSATGTIYKEGDVIPAGWIATYNNQKGFLGQPADVTSTERVNIPEVTSISYEKDADKVVILKNVTFTSATRTGEYFNGTTPDGTTYKFENTYNTPDQPAGTYNVKLVVRYAINGSTVYAWLAPIEYMTPGTGSDEPVFPEEFTITTDPSTLKVFQEPASEDDFGAVPYTIMVLGEIEKSTATVTIGVPEGWDGFIYMENSFAPWNGRKKAKSEWIPADEMLEWGWTEGNVLEIPADGMQHLYQILLVKDGQADEANGISLEAFISRDFSGVDLTFPETFDVTLSTDGLKVEQTQEVEWGEAWNTIIVSGETGADTVTLTLAVPEGWSGFMGATDADLESEIEPLSTRSDVEIQLMPLSYLEGGEIPVKEGNTFTFPVDGETHYGEAYLYIDDMFCVFPIRMEVTLEKGELSGVNAIEAVDNDARYFNLQGMEVKNPENGVFLKVSNGKTAKVNVK